MAETVLVFGAEAFEKRACSDGDKKSCSTWTAAGAINGGVDRCCRLLELRRPCARMESITSMSPRESLTPGFVPVTDIKLARRALTPQNELSNDQFES